MRIAHAILALLAFLLSVFQGCSNLRLEHPLRPAPGDWLTFAGSAVRTSSVSVTIAPPLAKEWEFDLGGGIGNGSPLVADSVLLVSNMHGELFAVHLRTGKRIGSVRLAEAIHGSPALDGGTVIVAASNTRESLLAYSLTEGKVRWKRECGDIEVSPLLMAGRIYVGNLQGSFLCTEHLNGSPVWKYDLPRNTKLKGIRSTPAGEDSTVVFGADDGIVYALNAVQGSERWKAPTGGSITSPLTIARGLVLAGNAAGTITALNLADGALRWRVETGAPVYANAAVNDSIAIVGNLAGTMYALRTGDGSIAWKTQIDGPVNAGALIAGATTYVGTLNKMLVALGTSSGAVVWRDTLEGRVKTSPVAAGGRVLVATDDWLLQSFRETPR